MSSDLRCSGAQKTPRSESDISVNFNNTNQIIAASNAVGASNQAQFYSTDGGVTWNQTSLPLNPGDSLHSDPTVDWTSDGTAWATTIGIDASTTVLQIRAYKSTNNGAEWTFDATVTGAQTAADKQMMWVDHSPTSPHKDNIYVIWHNNNPVFVNRRTGPSGAWQAPLQVSGTETTGTGIGGDIKTNSSGDVFAFWPDTMSRRLFVAKSTDGGVVFGTPVRISTTFDSFDIGIPSNASRRALIYLSGGAYRTAAQDMVYAVWTDLTGVAGVPACNSPENEPNNNVDSTCKSRIWFARSSDGGATWRAATMLNNQASLNDQFNPRMAVDETNGRLVVMYYDTVGDAGRQRTDVWLQTSLDVGATWTTAVKVSSAQTDETSAGADTGNQYGDYNGLSGYAGKFFPCWTDRRSGGKEEIWTAAIDTSGRVMVAEFASGPPVQVLYWEDWGQSPILDGWRDPEDIQLVGDFRGLGRDQVLFINRTGSGGRVMVADFASGPPVQVLYWEDWGQSPILDGWHDPEDIQLVGDFRGLGRDQVLFINRPL